jgi:protein-S-isoprenylcysteine O-methyltransferase Ste14
MPRELGLAAVNCALAALYTFFVCAHVSQFAAEPRLSLLLLVLTESVLVAIFLIRTPPKRTWHSWQTWITTAAGTFFPLLLRPAAGSDDLLVGEILQTVGAGLQVAAVLSLNRSMGWLPAHREVKSTGMYRVVRHPLYAAYTVALAGYLINNFSVANIVVLVIGTAFQVMRIYNEERLLSESSEYLAFAGRTRWRLVPYVW